MSSTLRSRTVDRLRQLIVAGKLPAGSRLVEVDLAQALGISRGSLREAIRELVDMGLLVSRPYKGLQVREVSHKDLEEIYSLRTALERLAFQQCWNRRTPKALDDLRRRGEKLTATIDAGDDPLGATEDELHLHSWCYEQARHDLLLQSWNRLKPNLQFYFAMHHQAHGRCGPRRDAHDVYLRLACGDDLDSMLSHLEDHMRQGLATTISFIATGTDTDPTGMT